MILAAHEDLSQLTKTQAKTKAVAHFYLKNCSDYDKYNGTIIT